MNYSTTLTLIPIDTALKYAYGRLIENAVIIFLIQFHPKYFMNFFTVDYSCDKYKRWSSKHCTTNSNDSLVDIINVQPMAVAIKINFNWVSGNRVKESNGYSRSLEKTIKDEGYDHTILEENVCRA